MGEIFLIKAYIYIFIQICNINTHRSTTTRSHSSNFVILASLLCLSLPNTQQRMQDFLLISFFFFFSLVEPPQHSYHQYYSSLVIVVVVFKRKILQKKHGEEEKWERLPFNSDSVVNASIQVGRRKKNERLIQRARLIISSDWARDNWADNAHIW